MRLGFNRRRLKGEYGIEDTKHALNTLFEVLYTLVRALAPFTPFLTETLYGRIVSYLPKSLHTEDMRSVHFQPYPEVRSDLFDEVVERQVGRMQRVIELGRISRERRAIGLKQPLKTLIVIHSPEYLEDIRALETEICEELNVHNLILTSDEDKYNVEYSLNADWPTLGKKLKKEAQKVKKLLPDVSSNDVRKFVQEKKMTIGGIELLEEDLVVKRGLREDEGSKDLETNTDNDVLTILDTKIYPELATEGLGREIVARVQQLRKESNLKTTDDVKMVYKVLSDPENVGIELAFETQQKLFEKVLRRPLDKHPVTQVGGETEPDEKEPGFIAQKFQEVQKATFLLRLLHL